MGRKINVNVCIVIAAATVLAIIFTAVISYGLSDKYTDKIKTAQLKDMINYAMPVVEYTYDSGKAEFSILTGIKNTLFDFTGVDTSNPMKMISEGSSLHKYYFKNYWNKPLVPPDGEITETPSPTPTVTLPAETEKPSETPENTAGQIMPTPSAPQSTSRPEVIKVGDGRYEYGNISIRNGSNLDIDFNGILKEPFESKFEDESEGAQILIYHTHTTECYINDLSEIDENNYNSWSDDNSKTVVRVGHELDNILSKQYGFNVIHNSTVHNYSYSESYNKSSITVRSVLKGNPTVKLSIDIHRDGLALGTGKLRVVQNVNGEDCAGIMFVVGTDETTSNPRWEDNLRLALLLAEKMDELAPGIIRYVSIRSSRYNQHIAENGLLVEFGGDGNTVSEVTNSAKYLAQAINEVMR